MTENNFQWLTLTSGDVELPPRRPVSPHGILFRSSALRSSPLLAKLKLVMGVLGEERFEENNQKHRDKEETVSKNLTEREKKKAVYLLSRVSALAFHETSNDDFLYRLSTVLEMLSKLHQVNFIQFKDIELKRLAVTEKSAERNTEATADTSYQYLFDELIKFQGLHTLIFTGCIIDMISGFEFGRSVSNYIVLCGGITTLCIENCFLGDAGAKFLSLASGYNKTIEHLFLSGNYITAVGCAELAKVLKDNYRLQELVLNNNLIGSKGVKVLLTGMKANQTLTKLRLRENEIGEHGARYISSILRKSCLEELDLSLNEITNVGCMHLRTGIAKSRTLKRLFLEKVGMSDAGCKAISKGLFVNDSVTDVDLSRNNIYREGLSELVANLDSNIVIQRVSLQSTPVVQDTQNQDLLLELSRKLASNQKVEIAEKKHSQLTQILRETDPQTKVPWLRYKLMFIGEEHSGKTATMKNLLDQEAGMKTVSTVGIQLDTASSDIFNMSKKAAINAKIQWKGMTASDSFALSTVSNLATRVLLSREHPPSVLDPEITIKQPSLKAEALRKPVVRMQRKRSIYKWHQEESTGTKSAMAIGPTSTLAQTSDLNDSKASVPRLFDERKLAKDYKKVYFDSERGYERMTYHLWDCDGQKVFHALRHLFLTPYATYVVTVNLVKLLNKTTVIETVHSVRYWLHSIRFHVGSAASILIIGTFLDKLPAAETKRLLKAADDLLKPLVNDYQVERWDENGVRCFLPLSNLQHQPTGFAEFNKLKQKLQTIAVNSFITQYEVPLLYSHIIDLMTSSENKSGYIYREKIVSLAKRFSPEIDEFEVDHMIDFFETIGAVVQLKGTGAMKDRIITNPQYIIDSLCAIIRDRTSHKHSPAVMKDLEVRELTQDFATYWDQGIVSRDLLEFFWGSDTNFFMDLMREAFLMSVHYSPSMRQQEEYFLVTSMLPEKSIDLTVEQQALHHWFLISFSERLFPFGLLERLFTFLLSYVSQVFEKKHKRKASEDETTTIQASSTGIRISLPSLETSLILVKHIEAASPKAKAAKSEIQLKCYASKTNIEELRVSMILDLLQSGLRLLTTAKGFISSFDDIAEAEQLETGVKAPRQSYSLDFQVLVNTEEKGLLPLKTAQANNIPPWANVNAAKLTFANSLDLHSLTSGF